jgi:hypothetical protein
MSSRTRRRPRRRLFSGCIVAALIAVGSFAAVSWADTIAPDADVVAIGNQASRNFGTVAPGATLTPAVSFELQCAGNQHVDNGGSVTFTFSAVGSTIPAGGSMTATSAAIGPIPSSWPDDNSQCGSTPPAPIQDNGNSTVTITAPSTSGSYTFVPRWSVGEPEPSDVTGPDPTVTFTLTVSDPDTTAPTVNCTVPSQTAWYASNATVGCAASDNGSGLANAGDASFSLATSVPSDHESASAATNSRQVCDNAGNCATVGPYTFMVDRKAPQLASCDAADGNWHPANVTLACHYTDGGSGPATQDVSLVTNVAAGDENANASALANGAQACDAVGNCADSPADIAGNMVDRKAPVIACGSPAPTFLLYQSPAMVTGTATDGGSGPGSQNLSAAADTSSVGAKTATLAALDNVGNARSKACPYNVIFNFHGFFQPVDGLPTMNAVKAGSAVPVKFDLSGNQGLSIFAAGYPRTTMISCNDSSPLDDIESTMTADGSSLNYDAAVNAPLGQYIYVWKTEKPWVGTCRQLDVMLIDGTAHSAKFKFK